MAGEATKRKLIEVTYRILQEKGFENLKAREIAKEAGCTATVIYKYFDNLNYLIVLASLRVLEEYNRESLEISKKTGDCITLNKMAWRAFIRHAFKNPRIFENLFWGKGKAVFEDAVIEYFELYPEELSGKTSAYYYATYFNSNLEERDFIWLRRGVNEGYLELEDAMYISRVNSMIVHGMLLEHMDDYTIPGVAEKAIKECIYLVEKNINTFLKVCPEGMCE